MHNGQTNNLIEIDCLVLEKDYRSSEDLKICQI